MAPIEHWTQGVHGAAIIAAAAVLPYLNSLPADWTYDDKVAVKANPDVLQLTPLADLFQHDFWGNYMWGAFWTHFSYRPLTILSFRLNHAMGGLNTVQFHVVNILLYAMSCVLAWKVCDRLLANCSKLLPLVAGIVFALHPVHSEVVANVTTRADSLASCFVFGAMLLYWDAKHLKDVTAQWTHLAGAMLCIVAGVLCKETAIVTPAFLICIEVLDPQPQSSPKNEPSFLRMALKHAWLKLKQIRPIVVTVFTVCLLYIRVMVLANGYQFTFAPFHNPIALVESPFWKFLSFAYVQSFAASMLVLPLHLAHEHVPIRPIVSIMDLRIAYILLFWAALVFLVWICVLGWKRSGGPTSTCLAAALMIVAYIPSSHILVKVGFMMAERTLYISVLGYGCLFALTLQAVAVQVSGLPVWSMWSTSQQLELWQRRVVVILACTGLLGAAYAARVYTRNQAWLDEPALLRASVSEYPMNAMSLCGIGYLYARDEKWAEADIYFRRAIKASERLFADPFIALGDLEARIRGNYAAAIEHFIAGVSTGSRIEYGANVWALSRFTNTSETNVVMYEAFALNAYHNNYLSSSQISHRAEVANNAGCVHLLSPPERYGNLQAAVTMFEEAIATYEPTSWGKFTPMFNLAITCIVGRQYQAAVDILQRILQETKILEAPTDASQTVSMVNKALAAAQTSLVHPPSDKLSVSDLMQVMGLGCNALLLKYF